MSGSRPVLAGGEGRQFGSVQCEADYNQDRHLVVIQIQPARDTRLRVIAGNALDAHAFGIEPPVGFTPQEQPKISPERHPDNDVPADLLGRERFEWCGDCHCPAGRCTTIELPTRKAGKARVQMQFRFSTAMLFGWWSRETTVCLDLNGHPLDAAEAQLASAESGSAAYAAAWRQLVEAVETGSIEHAGLLHELASWPGPLHDPALVYRYGYVHHAAEGYLLGWDNRSETPERHYVGPAGDFRNEGLVNDAVNALGPAQALASDASARSLLERCIQRFEERQS